MNSTDHVSLPSRLTLTLEAARIAVVDDGGNLILFQRIDGTQIGSADVAIGKARTAIACGLPGQDGQVALAGASALATAV